MTPSGYDSPTTVDAPLEYLVVEDYKWPEHAPPKRFRLDARERKRRHNECQKRFLARKRREFHGLRDDVARLELQVKWMEAKREAETLEQERRQLEMQLASGNQGTLKCPFWSVPTEPPTVVQSEDADVDWLDNDVVEALNVDALLAEFGLP